MREKLQAIGSHVKEVQLVCHNENNLRPLNSGRIIDVFTKLIGTNIVSLTIRNFVLFPQMIEKFNKIFPHLKKFEWLDNFFLNYRYDLASVCTNLETLITTQDAGFHPDAVPWPKLENLCVSAGYFYQSNSFLHVFRNNPQIKCLEMIEVNLESVLRCIVETLRQLRKLIIIDMMYEMVEADDLRLLSGMSNLTTIKLMELGPDNDLDEIFDIFCTMPQLSNIKVTLNNEVFEDEHLPLNGAKIRQLAQSLRNLKKFALSRCNLDTDDIITFIENSKALEKLSLLKTDVHFDLNVLFAIYLIRKERKRGKKLKLVLTDYEEDDVNEVNLV